MHLASEWPSFGQEMRQNVLSSPSCPLLESMNHAVPHLLRYDKNAAGIQNPDGKDVLSITDKNIHLQSSGYAREITVPSGFYKELDALSCNVEIN